MARLAQRIAVGIAVTVGLLGAAAAGAQAATVPHWRGVFRDSARSDTYLQSVAAPAKDDAWAVGYAEISGQSRSLIMHWNGVRWSRATITAPGAAQFQASSVVANGPADVWIFGQASATDPQPEALVLTSSWRVVQVPVTADPYAVVLRDGQVWAASGSTCAGNGSGCTARVWNYRDGRWSSSTVPTYLQGIAASANRVYVLGMSAIHNFTAARMTGVPAIYVRSAAQWDPLTAPSARVGPDNGLTVSPRGRLWLLATSTARRKPWHLDIWRAGAWTRHALPARLDGGPVLADGGDPVFDGHNGVWVGPYLHWTGQGWVNALRISTFPFSDLTQVAPVPGTRSAWGVGSALAATPGRTRAIIAVYGRLP